MLDLVVGALDFAVRLVRAWRDTGGAVTATQIRQAAEAVRLDVLTDSAAEAAAAASAVKDG
ncbi:MAG: hypothetical protein IPG96_16230 [Proteobacteria bacterium]|nr:hypothetical protein [Pseudomonadota bacterium]